MKTILKTVAFLCIAKFSLAQNGANSNNWKINGNSISTGEFIGTINNQPLIFKTNNQPRLTIDANGDLKLNALASPSGEQILMIDQTGKISSQMPNVVGLWNKSGNNLYYTGGNIGIGTSNPIFPLDVVGDARVSNNLYVGGGVVISDKISAITEVKGWDFKVDNDINIEGASRLKGSTRLDQGFTFDGINGVSLINTPSGQIMRYGNKTAQILPLSCAAGPLSTTFTQQFGGAIQIFDNNNPTTSGLLNLQTWTGGSSIDASVAGNSQAGLLINYFCGSNTYINTGGLGGEVFLGKSHIGNPLNISSTHFNDALLTVNGKIVSKSMFVTQQNWADFVFENDYKLPTLTEIESYYKANKHLPNIPSAKEVAENGIDLGEMNKLLLQKIEELTILMVQQEKRIKELENKQ